MTNGRWQGLARWRALLQLMWRAAGGRLVLFGVLILVAGLMPTAVILMTGALVRAIPAAVEHGLSAPQGHAAVLALTGLVGGLVAASLANSALAYLTRVIDTATAVEVHRLVGDVTLGTPGLAALEDPAFADELQAVIDAERRATLRWSAAALSGVATTRLRGAGAFVVLLSFSWWAPFLLAAAWHLTNVVFVKASQRGVSVQMNDGATRMRRAEYMRSLALEPAAAKEIRVFGLSGWVVGRYGQAWLDALSVLWDNRRANRSLTAAAIVALVVSHGAVLAAMGSAAASGALSAATLLVLVQAVLATSDLGLIGDWQWSLMQSLAVVQRVTGLKVPGAALPAAAPPRALLAPPQGGKLSVRLDGVRFTYPSRDRATLDGLTLEIPAGQSVAIVGENGAGKSTLIKLLCGLYEPDAGRITVGGSATPLEARGRIGVIFQDFVRYPLPLRDNVGFGHLPLIGDAAALDASLRDAGAGRILSRLPNGWDTVLSREFEGGADLSGGQWQRVALARALFAVRGGAGLLILDEPTAALDVRAETELFERFLELTRDVTTILVSHRLSSVRRADRIVVVEGGRIVEDGTHDQLMRAGGRYAEMFSLQAERFALAQAVAEPAAQEVCDA
ncbi:MAG TPA: ABC transporter ATP-binding protein [Longimicrobium sp.]|nr:ABC transporter ATP-binding protein [Longimicrobium sp.]